MSEEPKQNKGEGLIDRKLVEDPVILLLSVPGRLFCFGSLVVLDLVRGNALLFLLDKQKIVK